MPDQNKPIPATLPPPPRVADSMDAAVGILALSVAPNERLSIDDLKRAKAAGCPAFRGSRVDLDALLEWWAENADTLPTGNSRLDAINIELAEEKLLRARFAREQEQGKYITVEAVAAKIEVLGLELKDTLRRRLEEEYPARLANRSAEECAALLRNVVDEICHEFHTGAKKCAK